MDSNGNEVVFDSPPERIVVYDSAVVEILFAIGEGKRVIGAHDFVSYPPEVADIPRMGGAFNIDLEAVVAVEPDLVFVFSPTFLEQLENAKLKVLYLKSLQEDVARVAENIRLWGRIVGNQKGAQAAAVEFESRVMKVIETMRDKIEGPKVFDILKMQNIAHDISGYAQLSPEILVERDPEVVIASYGDNISDNPALAGVTAVKTRRVFVPSSDALSIAGPRFVEGMEELARWVYPDLFE